MYAEIVRLMPEKAILYYADSMNCPYGDKNEQQIVEMSRKCVKDLVGQGVEVIVIACNTITSVAGEILREQFPNIDIIGMEPAIKPAAEISKAKIVAVLATKATLATQKYHNTRDKYAKGVKVIEIAGEGLVEMVENDTVDTVESVELVRKYISELENEGADVVVLGCTHYPFLKEVIERVSTKGIEIIDPAEAVARRVKEVVENRAKKLGIMAQNEKFEEIFFSSKKNQEIRIEKIARSLRENVLGKLNE